MLVKSPGSESISMIQLCVKYIEWYNKTIKSAVLAIPDISAAFQISCIAPSLETRIGGIIFLQNHQIKQSPEDPISKNESQYTYAEVDAAVLAAEIAALEVKLAADTNSVGVANRTITHGGATYRVSNSAKDPPLGQRPSAQIAGVKYNTGLFITQSLVKAAAAPISIMTLVTHFYRHYDPKLVKLSTGDMMAALVDSCLGPSFEYQRGGLLFLTGHRIISPADGIRPGETPVNGGESEYESPNHICKKCNRPFAIEACLLAHICDGINISGTAPIAKAATAVPDAAPEERNSKPILISCSLAEGLSTFIDTFIVKSPGHEEIDLMDIVYQFTMWFHKTREYNPSGHVTNRAIMKGFRKSSVRPSIEDRGGWYCLNDHRLAGGFLPILDHSYVYESPNYICKKCNQYFARESWYGHHRCEGNDSEESADNSISSLPPHTDLEYDAILALL